MQLPSPRFSVMPFGGYDTSEVDAFIDRLEQATSVQPPAIGADDVRAVTFSSARTRGYAAAEVDRWLDPVADAAGAVRGGPSEAQTQPRPPAAVANPAPIRQPSSASTRPADAQPEPGQLVGVVRQSRSLPKAVLLTLIAAALVAIVLAIYFAG